MSNLVEYYFSISSPWAYLGFDRLRALASEYSFQIKPYPITIIEENGAIAAATRPAPRRSYMLRDLRRWAHYLDKTVKLENRPTGDWVPASFMVIAAELDGLDWQVLTAALQEQWWGHAEDIGQADVRKRIACDAGFDGSALVARERAPDVQAKWKENRERALARGIFGSPTYVYEDELYWGQDSLQFLKMHLSGKRAPL